jgi:hypothetical protein
MDESIIFAARAMAGFRSMPRWALRGIASVGEVIDVVTRLATRLSYASVQHTLRGSIGWSPSPEAIGRLTIGLDQQAPAFMGTEGPLAGDGKVLVIEVEGEAAPMVTEEELAARRVPRDK